MPVDQLENPCIRTKLLRLDEEIDDDFFRLLERLRAGEITVEAFQAATLEFLENLRLSKTFSKVIAIAERSEDQHWLVRRHTDSCRYTILLYRVDKDKAQPPHQHHNLISTQVVISGHIHLREYERVRFGEDGKLELRLARDAVLGPGDVIQASEWYRNVHWFSGEGGPAIILQINSRGYEKAAFDENDDGPFGRRYLDPTHFGESGLISCEELDVAEAARRFKNKPLSAFRAPDPEPCETAPLTIAI